MNAASTGPAPKVVVLDASVLFPMPLCDTLLRAARRGLYQAHWTEDIVEELRRNLVRDLKLSPDRVAYRIAEMRGALPDANIEGYQALVGAMTNHPKDRHVLAAAVAGEADVIVTSNLRHFPEAALEPFAVRVLSPDEFMSDLFDREPEIVRTLLREQAAGLKRPPKSVADVINELRQHAPAFCAAVTVAEVTDSL